MSTVLSPDKDYAFAPAPAPAVLDRETWDAVMASLGGRLRALEAKRTELQDLLDDLSFNGQARIDAAITPLIEEVEAEVVQLRGMVAQTIQDAADAATAVTTEVRARVTALEGRLVAAEAAYDQIISGGVSAAKVNETAERVFVSPAQRSKIDLAAPLAAPVFTGIPKAPTAAQGNNSTQLATTAFVAAAISAILNGSPELLDTLDELAAAIGDDPNFAATMATSLGNRLRVDAAQGLTAAQKVRGLSNLGLTISDFIITLLDDANASTALSTLGVSAFIKTLLDDADAATALTTLGGSALGKNLFGAASQANAKSLIGYAPRAFIASNASAITLGSAGAYVVSIDFVATGTLALMHAISAVEGGSQAYCYNNIQLFALPSATLLSTSAETYILHNANQAEAAAVLHVAEGLTVGQTYRAWLVGRTNINTATINRAVISVACL